MNELAIIDSGGANIASLQIAFDRLGVNAKLTTDATTIQSAKRVLLPGVGAARNAMTRLSDAGLVDVIKNLTQPVLGICLGMQLLCAGSEEENVDCLGILPGVATQLPASSSYQVPNMGWCSTDARLEHSLMRGIPSGSYFYYLHSYALPIAEYTFATAQHAAPFSALISHENFVAAQFHPERSSAAGARFLQNFLDTPQ